MKSKVWHLRFLVVLSLNCQVVVWKTPKLKQPGFISQKGVGRTPMNARVRGHQNIRLSLPNRPDWPTWFKQIFKQNRTSCVMLGDITGTVQWQKCSSTLCMVHFCGVRAAFETAGLYYQWMYWDIEMLKVKMTTKSCWKCVSK